jgi:hypothetical protein
MQIEEGKIKLQIELIGYQFPELENDGWLNVRLTLECHTNKWLVTDPALETLEVREFLDWLAEVADNLDAFARWKHINRLSTRQFFTEPCLGFEVFSGHPTGMPVTFRIYLAAECLPSEPATFGIIDPIPGEGEAWLDFGVDEAILREIIEDLQSQLALYPVRVALKKSTDA